MSDAEPQLAWTIESRDQSTVVHLRGDVDLATQEDFDEAVRAGLDSAAPVVILDLGGVTFLGSVGLRSLVHANRETQQTGRVLRVVDGGPIVHRIMEVTGLAQVLSVYPTLDEAQSC